MEIAEPGLNNKYWKEAWAYRRFFSGNTNFVEAEEELREIGGWR